MEYGPVSCKVNNKVEGLHYRVYNNKDVKISVIATRYTGTDHQYKTVTTNPTHSGGKGGSN